MIEIRLLDNVSAPRWERFVDTCPQAGFFHKAGWRRVIEKSFSHKTYFMYAEDNGEIRGVLPLVHVKSLLFGNGLISTAFTTGGGVAATDEAARQALDAHATSLCGKLGAKFIEYRGVEIIPPGWHARNDLYANFSREIAESEDACLKQIPRKQRAVLRKALESDPGYAIDRSAGNFYDLFSASVHRLGTPVQSRAYFANLLEEFGGESCDILTISASGKPMSSVLSFYFRDTVMPYFTGGSLRAREYGANDLMYWHLMRRARQRGFLVFDFGRSKTGTGPYSFKKNWGFAPVPVTHAFYLPDQAAMPDTNPANPKYQLLIKAWQRMPLAMANLVGPHIVRGIG